MTKTIGEILMRFLMKININNFILINSVTLTLLVKR